MKKILGYTLLSSFLTFLIVGVPLLAGAPWWVPLVVIGGAGAVIGIVFLSLWLIGDW